MPWERCDGIIKNFCFDPRYSLKHSFPGRWSIELNRNGFSKPAPGDCVSNQLHRCRILQLTNWVCLCSCILEFWIHNFQLTAPTNALSQSESVGANWGGLTVRNEQRRNQNRTLREKSELCVWGTNMINYIVTVIFAFSLYKTNAKTMQMKR